MSSLRAKQLVFWSAIIAAVLGPVSISLAEPTGLVIDASAMRFIYTKGTGGSGSFGHINIGQSGGSSLVVQELTLGSDGQFGGGNDTIIDMARVTQGGFNASFSADVFKLGSNSYSIVGTYTVEDANGNVVVEGDFNSDLTSLNNNYLYLGGSLTNADSILRPGGTNSWVFDGTASSTPNTINGLFGGADGIDGTVTLDRYREYATLANLFEFQFVGSFPDLDAFFNSAIQASNLADLRVQVVVPSPGATGLAIFGFAMVAAIRRRFGAPGEPVPAVA